MKSSAACSAAAAFALLTCAGAQPAAAIKCDGPYQIVAGNPVATPYCEDSYIAYVASRYHGMHVSAYAVRQNPNVKKDVCRQVGYDTRIRALCLDYLDDRPDRR